MELNQETVQSLTQLREKSKFTDSDWDKRGLIPSDQEKISEMTRLLNVCLDELLTDLRSKAPERQIRKTLSKGLKRFKSKDYDTEEKEFIGDEFHKIGALLQLDISDYLNSWLYGGFLGTVVNLAKRKEIIIETKSIACNKCKTTLSIKVTARKEDIPKYWIIGQCIQCGEYNLLPTGENAGGIKFQNFTSVEMLDSNENSEEQAKTRLEQIRYFRGRN